KVIAGTYKLTQEADIAIPERLEQQQVLTARRVVADGEIAALPAHVARLSLTEIAIHTICGPAICIPVLPPRGTSECNHDRVVLWCAYAALPLASEPSVNVASTIVRPADLVAPECHLSPPVLVQPAPVAFHRHRWSRETSLGVNAPWRSVCFVGAVGSAVQSLLGSGVSAAEDVRPHRIHLGLPHRFGVRLLGQLVEGEADGALYGRTGLLRGAPVKAEVIV